MLGRTTCVLHKIFNFEYSLFGREYFQQVEILNLKKHKTYQNTEVPRLKQFYCLVRSSI